MTISINDNHSNSYYQQYYSRLNQQNSRATEIEYQGMSHKDNKTSEQCYEALQDENSSLNYTGNLLMKQKLDRLI